MKLWALHAVLLQGDSPPVDAFGKELGQHVVHLLGLRPGPHLQSAGEDDARRLRPPGQDPGLAQGGHEGGTHAPRLGGLQPRPHPDARGGHNHVGWLVDHVEGGAAQLVVVGQVEGVHAGPVDDSCASPPEELRLLLPPAIGGDADHEPFERARGHAINCPLTP